jgi:hypothetical protein
VTAGIWVKPSIGNGDWGRKLESYDPMVYQSLMEEGFTTSLASLRFVRHMLPNPLGSLYTAYPV